VTLLGIDVSGRAVLVVGGGPVAARRARSLASDGADVLVVAPNLCEELKELCDSAAVRWRAAVVVEADLDGVWLVHTATGHARVDEAVSAWAAERRIWCVNASDASQGTARTPATTQAGDVLVGVVSTREPDPGRSRRIRDHFAGELREGRVPLRRERAGASGGRVVLVGGGPGDVDLLTIGGRRALAEADVVVTDRLGPTGVLAELDPGVEVIHVGKAPGNHPVPQEEINRILVERAQRGQVVVRLKGGDSYIFGRGGEEVLACRKAGIPVEVVPGVSSALAVPTLAGISLTYRAVAQTLVVTTGHEGLDPAARAAVGHGGATLVVLMGVSLLRRIAGEAIESGADPSTPVAIVERGSTPTQRATYGRLDTIADRAEAAGVRAPAVIVIGAVAADGFLGPTPPDDTITG
jgi:uroporphyrin-III C-methyltransferase/precorrin-2 dehydrogenase/sirohydrochlorin ferrochelatase